MTLTFNISNMNLSEIIFLKEVILNVDFFKEYPQYKKIIINP